MDAHLLIVFTDIRGFTKWSESTEVYIYLDRFIRNYQDLLERRFPKRNYTIKSLGDGAMITREISENLSDKKLRDLLNQILRVIHRCELEFDELCTTFSTRVGHEAPLKLGWGIVRGKAVALAGDYVGHNLNKAARLCDQARPFGIVIDKDDFPRVTDNPYYSFTDRIMRLTGIGEVGVRVTTEIATQFLTREYVKQTPEVHVAGICVDVNTRDELRVLIARRSSERKLFPNLIEGCGGQLAYSETFTDGVRRHFKLEMNIDINVLENIHVFYVINQANEPLIPGIRFLCVKTGDDHPRSVNHSEVDWVTEEEFRNLDGAHFIPGLKEQALQLIDLYKSSRT